MAEQCSFCGNTHLTPKTTRYIHQQNGEMLFVEQVPCLECDYGGEQYFEIDVLKRIIAPSSSTASHRAGSYKSLCKSSRRRPDEIDRERMHDTQTRLGRIAKSNRTDIGLPVWVDQALRV